MQQIPRSSFGSTRDRNAKQLLLHAEGWRRIKHPNRAPPPNQRFIFSLLPTAAQQVPQCCAHLTMHQGGRCLRSPGEAASLLVMLSSMIRSIGSPGSCCRRSSTCCTSSRLPVSTSTGKRISFILKYSCQHPSISEQVGTQMLHIVWAPTSTGNAILGPQASASGPHSENGNSRSEHLESISASSPLGHKSAI